MLLELLAKDEAYLRENPQTPLLIDSGVRYEREPPGQELWLTIPWVRLMGHGDCEDLACWRAAELRVRGEDARPFHTLRYTPKGRLYHIRVKRADGTIEDPSAALGMYVQEEARKFWMPRMRIVDGERS